MMQSKKPNIKLFTILWGGRFFSQDLMTKGFPFSWRMAQTSGGSAFCFLFALCFPSLSLNGSNQLSLGATRYSYLWLSCQACSVH